MLTCYFIVGNASCVPCIRRRSSPPNASRQAYTSFKKEIKIIFISSFLTISKGTYSTISQQFCSLHSHSEFYSESVNCYSLFGSWNYVCPPFPPKDWSALLSPPEDWSLEIPQGTWWGVNCLSIPEEARTNWNFSICGWLKTISSLVRT